eukprot:Skav230029  [mRNA]  locus=scaffold261:288206:289162:- [translate_table: standard]
MLDARKLQHQSNLTWQSRCAPRCVGDELPGGWRERALKHRELCPVLGQRAPKSATASPVEEHALRVHKEPVEDFDLQSVCSTKPPEKPADDDVDGDATGVLCRVELSRYIARRGAILALESERSRCQHTEAFSSSCESDDWTKEVPGTRAAEILSLKDTDAWKTVLDAISFERTHLRRGFSNHWPDVLWSPACLDSESATALEIQLAEWIKDLEALADGSDAIRNGLRTMPIAVLLRQLLCDFRIAIGDLKGAARALAGAVATESGDPLRPPLLVGWEDSLSCDYLKAQQCFRLARLALLAVAESCAEAKAHHGARVL